MSEHALDQIAARGHSSRREGAPVHQLIADDRGGIIDLIAHSGKGRRQFSGSSEFLHRACVNPNPSSMARRFFETEAAKPIKPAFCFNLAASQLLTSDAITLQLRCVVCHPFPSHDFLQGLSQGISIKENGKQQKLPARRRELARYLDHCLDSLVYRFTVIPNNKD